MRPIKHVKGAIVLQYVDNILEVFSNFKVVNRKKCLNCLRGHVTRIRRVVAKIDFCFFAKY
jgi:hypothetical protein